MKFFLISALCLFLISAVFATELTYTGTWASSQYWTGEWPDIDLQGNSLRQIVRVSIPGEQLRFHFSNLFGSGELELQAVHIAKSAGQGTGSIVPETDTEITFDGQQSIVLPANSDIISDTIPFHIDALDEVAITIQYGKIPAELTGHAGARTFSYIELGNAVSQETFPQQYKFVRWHTISAIDVVADVEKTGAVLCYGDSITDGRGSTNDKQNRWTDAFAEKLQANPLTQHLAVLNHGIGGSSLHGPNSVRWPTGLGRYQKDVVEQTNVKYMIVLYGVNDIVYGGKTAPILIDAFKELIQRNHDLGIITYGSPILPFKSNDGWTEEREQIREDVNNWIMNTPASEGGFDAVIDFASVVADPNDPLVFNADLCDGDGLHPNYLGHAAIGNAVDLSLFIEDDEVSSDDENDVDVDVNADDVVEEEDSASDDEATADAE